jgi:alkylation response protein AidB-like acyl-CoA dehydrogenase
MKAYPITPSDEEPKRGGIDNRRMNLSLSEEQRLVRDAAETFLADVSDSAAVRRHVDLPLGYDEALWRRIGQELGWCGIAIDEADGGLGLGPLALAMVAEQTGRHLLCAPFFTTVAVGVPVIQAMGTEAARAALLPAIAAGELRLGLTVPSAEQAWVDDARALSARSVGAGWRLHGRQRHMMHARGAEGLLVFASLEDGGLGLFLVDGTAEGVRMTARPGWDATRPTDDVQFDDAPVRLRVDDPARSDDGMLEALALARLFLAAEQLGSAQQCLDLTVAYTTTRKQFGRPVGGFQAVKHRCAEMMVRIEALRSAVQGAAVYAERRPAPELLARECAMARALAADTAFFCAQEAIQLHGGVGFTWEYDPQLYFKRAQAASHWLGTADAQREEIAAALFDAGQAVTEAPAADEPLADFRREVADWMAAHLTGSFAALRHRGGPGDEEADPALRKDWERTLARGGWVGVGWPQRVGGRGLSIDRQVVFHEEYARAGGPGRMGHIGEGLIGPAIIEYGTPAQQARLLPPILQGTCFWAQGYSEPGAGSDLANVQTRAVPEADGGWRISGQKIWTSLAHESDWIFALARSEPGSKGNKGLIFVVLPLTQPGIEIRPIRQLGGGCEFNEVFFDNVRVEPDDVIGAPGEGWKVAMGLLEIERGVSTLGQQMHFSHELERVIEAARRYGRDRDPQIRARVAQAWCGLRVMRYNALRMLGNEGLGLQREALIYKYYWSNWHRDLGKLAMDILGPEGDVISDDPLLRPLQQLFFFSRADTLYAGTNEIQLNLISERGLGMPREPRMTT